MAAINELIIKKLKAYAPDVQHIAKKALELSESQQELTVSERIEAEIRKLIKMDGSK